MLLENYIIKEQLGEVLLFKKNKKNRDHMEQLI